MARKRANLAGHGMEILFGAQDDRPPNGTRRSSAARDERAARSGQAAGGKPSGDRRPGSESTPVAERRAPAQATAPSSTGATAQAVIRGDWWAALEEEAKSAVPPSAREVEADGAGTRERADTVRRFVTSFMADERDTPFASNPRAQRSAPSAAPDLAADDPPSVAATPSFAEDDLPALATTPALEPDTAPSTLYAAPLASSAKSAPRVAATLATDPFEPDGPSAAPIDLPELEQSEEGQQSRVRDEDEVLAYIGDEQRQQLWQTIARLYDEVPQVLVHDELQDEALQLLQAAQDILMERPRQFDVAKYKVGQVASILTRRRQTTRWTNTYGWLTFLYEAAWVIVLSGAIFYAPAFVASITSSFGASESLISIEQLWNTAAWGGVGGVLGALYSLYWHAAKVKDFDKQYLMWYVVQPVIGLIIGASLHVIIGAGFLTLIGEPAVEQGTPLRLFPYALSVIAAFRQRFILEVVDRVIQFVTRTGDQGTTSEPSAVSGGRAGSS
jgi:hypothetical protein